MKVKHKLHLAINYDIIITAHDWLEVYLSTKVGTLDLQKSVFWNKTQKSIVVKDEIIVRSRFRKFEFFNVEVGSYIDRAVKGFWMLTEIEIKLKW